MRAFLLLLLITLIAKAETGESWWQNSGYFASLRTLWIDADTETATAVGGRFGFETRPFYGASAKVAVTASQRFWGINPDGDGRVHGDPYDADKRSFTYLSEVERRYVSGEMLLRGGRLAVETPYADPDDIRMAANTFEGASAAWNRGDLSISTLYLTRWAGTDSVDSGDQASFKRFAPDSDGMAAVAVVYGAGEDTEIGLWGFDADRLFQLVYIEAVGALGDVWRLEFGLQGAMIRAKSHSGIAGDLAGVTATLHYRYLYVAGAYEIALTSGKGALTDGFGGGPYYAAMDEATIAQVSESAPGRDIAAFRLAAGIDMAWWPHPEEAGLFVEAAYGQFDVCCGQRVQERNLMLWHTLRDSLRIDAVFADFRAKDDAVLADFQRTWVRLDYTF